MNTRTDLIETSRRMRRLISEAFEQLQSEIDELPISDPVQFGPPGCHILRPEPDELFDAIDPKDTGRNHIRHLVSMWVVQPASRPDQIASIYKWLLSEADEIAAATNQARKDGEDSCQC